MAIVTKPNYGLMRGKSGSFNFHIDRYGNQIMRRNPGRSNRTASKREKENRTRFGILENLRKGFSVFYPFAVDSSKMNGLAKNSYFQRLNKDAVSFRDGEFEIDYGKIRIGEGELIPPEDVRGHISDREIFFEWKPGHGVNGDESVFIGIYNSVLNTSLISSPVNRRDGRCTMAIPGDWIVDFLHVYSFTRNASGRVSHMNYFSLK